MAELLGEELPGDHSDPAGCDAGDATCDGAVEDDIAIIIIIIGSFLAWVLTAGKRDSTGSRGSQPRCPLRKASVELGRQQPGRQMQLSDGSWSQRCDLLTALGRRGPTASHVACPGRSGRVRRASTATAASSWPAVVPSVWRRARRGRHTGRNSNEPKRGPGAQHSSVAVLTTGQGRVLPRPLPVTGRASFFHVIIHSITATIDPAEPNMRLKNHLDLMPPSDRSKHEHVIEDQYCHLCEVFVSLKAKHCSSCNKCETGFDRHCKWLSYCVGTRNCRFFFSLVTSASVGLVCVTAVLLYVFVQFYTDPDQLRADPEWTDLRGTNTWLRFLPFFPVAVDTHVMLCILISTVLLDTGSLIVIRHLLIFYLYLMSRKLSTFEYITQNRKEQLESIAETDPPVRTEEGTDQAPLSLRLKATVDRTARVAPFEVRGSHLHARPRPPRIHPRFCSHQGLVLFEDVALAFTWEEQQDPDDAQRILYRFVMLETCSSLVSLGK
ncbi:PREDICTED: uncharacterized protein LOC105808114 [Propithecus coquereli]|uniref:uncharacterized protein LOC105808114 n=1 Tax=Propithecus coquereli TaxID=379532 RepID=UPI00063F516E|nr:PREDICTED: uncharacterized protein LOC105808114 [Propithecus coquereli]